MQGGFKYGEQGWCSGESARLPPMCRRHMWLEFVVGSRLASRGFSLGSLVFLLPQKINTSKFQFDLETVDEEPPILFIHLFTYLFIYLFIYTQNFTKNV